MGPGGEIVIAVAGIAPDGEVASPSAPPKGRNPRVPPSACEQLDLARPAAMSAPDGASPVPCTWPRRSAGHRVGDPPAGRRTMSPAVPGVPRKRLNEQLRSSLRRRARVGQIGAHDSPTGQTAMPPPPVAPRDRRAGAAGSAREGQAGDEHGRSGAPDQGMAAHRLRRASGGGQEVTPRASRVRRSFAAADRSPLRGTRQSAAQSARSADRRVEEPRQHLGAAGRAASAPPGPAR